MKRILIFQTVLTFLLTGCSSTPAPVDASASAPSTVISSQEIVRPKVDFSGLWEMDYRLSDRADLKIRAKYLEALIEERRQYQQEQEREMRHFGNLIGPMVLLNEDPRRSRSQGVIAIGTLAEKISKSSVFRIRQSETQIVIDRDEDFSLVCNFMEQSSRVSSLGAERCYWHGDQLVFDIMLPDGLDVRHVLSLGKNSQILNVATTLFYRKAGPPFTLNRAYIPFESVESTYDCEFKLTTLKTCTMGSPD